MIGFNFFADFLYNESEDVFNLEPARPCQVFFRP